MRITISFGLLLLALVGVSTGVGEGVCNCTDIFDKIDSSTSDLQTIVETGNHQNALLYDQTQRSIDDLAAALLDGFRQLNVSVAINTNSSAAQLLPFMETLLHQGSSINKSLSDASASSTGLQHTVVDSISSSVSNLIVPFKQTLDDLRVFVIFTFILSILSIFSNIVFVLYFCSGTKEALLAKQSSPKSANVITVE